MRRTGRMADIFSSATHRVVSENASSSILCSRLRLYTSSSNVNSSVSSTGHGNIQLLSPRFFNCDESMAAVVHHRHSEVLGKRKITALQDAEHGTRITVVTYTSLTCSYVPSLLIFPRSNTELELMNCTPRRSIYECHRSGWIQSHAFTG
jgi:hypothetical protein